MKAVVAHTGSRDHYQLALALSEDDLLADLVTELYVTPGIVDAVRRLGAPRVAGLLARRSAVGLRRPRLKLMPGTLIRERLSPRVSDPSRLWAANERAISLAALRKAEKMGAALYLYSYYAREAFEGAITRGIPRLLFQLHPHPRECRKLYEEEIERVPEAATSIRREKEMLIEKWELERLSAEPALASHITVASSYTKHTLVAQGVAPERISVTPYGVDVSRFPTRTRPPPGSGPLRIAFVGSFIQRKGISYLLDAVNRFGSNQVKLIVATRSLREADLPATARSPNVEFRLGLHGPELVRMLHGCHLFALPSLLEGFGLVIAEAMATGLPVLATTNTSAADLVIEGETGFIVPIRSVDAIERVIQDSISRRDELFDMGQAAAHVARSLSWPHFRKAITTNYRQLFEG